ncbi:MAG: sigma 54-interacting transcriptional regulator [Deltaproteobacteria bacterium]|nr:sigma 54-interacting transcriptional regulator [Deltaproteobacteria bacterium]
MVAERILVDGARHSLADLQKLHDELQALGGVVVLGGPRGVGKGHLLAELRKELGRTGRLVLFGRAEQTATQPYAMLRDPAAQALAFLESRGIADGFLDTHSRALSVLVPALAHSSSSGFSRARDKTAFLEGLRALFLDLSKHTPLTLQLADLHYADDDTRDAVRFLARHLFNPDGVDVDHHFTGVLMAAARTDEAESKALVDALAEGPRSRLFVLEGLSRAGLATYLAGHPLLDRLLTASRGRPEDVDELLEALPKDTDALLLQRLAALDDKARRAVTALAALGRPGTADLVAAVVGAAVGEVARHLGSLVEARLLVRRLHNGELLFSFARPHHQEVVLRALHDDVARGMHQSIGVAFEAREASEQLLAFHLLRGTEPTRGLPYALSAAEKLLLTFAYGSAVELLRQALPVAANVDDDAVRETRFLLLGHLAEAERLRGQLPAALIAAEEMRLLARPEQMPQVLRRIGELLSQRGEHREALDVLEEALTRADEQRDTQAPITTTTTTSLAAEDGDVLPERALVLAAMAEVAYKKSDLDGANAFAERALHAAPKAPPAFRLRVKNTLGKVVYSREAYAAAVAAFLDNLKLAEEQGLEPEAVLARINVGLALHRLGRHVEAREILERALTAARAVGDLANEAFALLNLGTISQRLGELPRALDAYRAALTRFLRIGNRGEIRRTTWNLANLSVALGHLDAAETYLEQSRRIAVDDEDSRGLAFVHATEAELALARGEPARALIGYEKACDAFARLNEKSRVDEMTGKAAWALLLVGDVDAAAKKLATVPAPTAGIAQARHQAIEGAISTYAAGASAGSATGEALVGLARLQAAVDELVRLQATDDAWRAFLFLADRADELGDAKTAESARARGRAVVEKSAAGLPPDLKAILMADPMRARLFGVVAKELLRGLPSGRDPEAIGNGPSVVDVVATDREFSVVHTFPALAAVPRKPEWDTRYKELVGRSSSLYRVLDRLDRLTRTKQATVLIRGESGTGKELVAAAIHKQSERHGGPFVRVNCAALVETLLMSELFGHEKGSFTGALARKIGRFELARAGTIFLDEIGDISPKTQVSLLRVLQERQFERVGGTQTVHTDAVVICATHRDLEEMVRQGSFREDLYYRLKGVVVEVPALRERPEDIPLLVAAFLDKARGELGRAPKRVTAAATEVLSRYRWPGNIRELQNVVRSVALFCESEVVDVDDLAEFPELFQNTHAPAPIVHMPLMSELPRSIERSAPERHHEPPPPPRSVITELPTTTTTADPPTLPGNNGGTRDVLRRVGEESEGLALGDLKRRLEFEAIANAIRQTGGNVTRAAALLKMKRPRLSQIINGNPELKAIKEALRGADDDDA